MRQQLSLYEKIRRDIERKILGGTWGPGYRIPFEHELVAKYGCSRMTVNKAITALAEAGLVRRRRRAGTFVAPSGLEEAALEIPDIPADIAARGMRYGVCILERRTRRPETEAETEKELAGTGRLLELVCLHLADEHPFALERRLISLNAVPAAEVADFSLTPPGTWLLRTIPWTAAKHTIRAVTPSPDEANHLSIRQTAACLQLERKTWRGAVHITWVKQTFPGDALRLVAHFRPAHTRKA